MDVSDDGNTDYYTEGLFTGDPFPRKADLAVAFRITEVFRTGANLKRQPDELLEAINTEGLEYAAAISRDERELFFTRLHLFTRLHRGRLGIYRATRHTATDPFGSGQRIGAITGHVGAPTLSPDERLLYYYRKDADGTFRIYSVRR